jgi:hypothetical protein
MAERVQYFQVRTKVCILIGDLANLAFHVISSMLDKSVISSQEDSD